MPALADSRYAAILRTRHVGPLLGASLLGRLPIGIHGLAIVLFVRGETGSFAIAGAVSGAFALGAGIGAPVAGRLIDRFGQARVLVPLALLHAAALVGLVGSTAAGAPTAAMMACALVAGTGIPPLSSVLRSLWPVLLAGRRELIDTAYALDSVFVELLFVLGPLLTAAIITVLSPGAALVLAAVLVIAGTLAFVVTPPSRAFRPTRSDHAHGPLGALGSPGLRTLVLTTLPIGFCLGAVEVTLPAFAAAQGTDELAGPLLALWSCGSAAGGLAYGIAPRRRPLASVYLWLAALLPLGFVPLAVAPASTAVMLALVIPAGVTVAPLLAAGNQLVGDVALPGVLTEAYTWPITSLVGGVAAGSAAAGAIVEAADWRTAFAVAAVAGTLGVVAAFSRRATLTVAPAAAAAG